MSTFQLDYEFLSKFGNGGWLISGCHMHPNPRLYKYKWQIYWRDSPREGSSFLEMEPMATEKALVLMDWLKSKNEPYLISNTRLRRRGVAIWDLNSPALNNEAWAPAYDDDPDPIHSTGHR
jgi:hypothetical protein